LQLEVGRRESSDGWCSHHAYSPAMHGSPRPQRQRSIDELIAAGLLIPRRSRPDPRTRIEPVRLATSRSVSDVVIAERDDS
jgi:hypothetical protein